MDKKTEARIKDLDDRLKNAVVEMLTDNEPVTEDGPVSNTYSVFIPGAIREENTVVATSEKEAVEKVRACLVPKIEQISRKRAENPDNGEKATLEPHNLKIEPKTDNVGGMN